MNCPNCGRIFRVAPRVVTSVENNPTETRVARALCCGKGVVVFANVTYRIAVYKGDKTEDDFGKPLLAVNA